MEASIVRKYEDLLAKDPNSRVFAQLGELYRKMGMLEQAMQTFREGIKKHPSYSLGYLGLSFCYVEMEQYQLAYATLRPLVESSRDNIRMQKLFAECCEKLSYKDEALETWKYLLFINPREPLYMAKVSALEASPDAASEDIPRTQSFNVEKISSSPVDDVDDWIRVDLASEPEAQVELESLAQVMPLKSGQQETKDDKTTEAPFMSLTLVDLYIAQGHETKAREVLEKMLELNPSDVRLLDKFKELVQIDESVEISEEDAHSRLLKMVEEKQDSITSDDETDYIEITSQKFDNFLRGIKRRAEEKNTRF